MKLLMIIPLLTLTACSLPNSDIDSGLNRFVDKEHGVVCYTIDKKEGLFCLQSNKLQMESLMEGALIITPDKTK